MAENILPCPFCGASASVEQIDRGENFNGERRVVFSVGCNSLTEDSCMGYQSFQTFALRGEAIAAWNKRAPVNIHQRSGSER